MNEPRNVRDGQRPTRSRDEKNRTDCPSITGSEGPNLADDTLILDGRAPELGSNMLLLSKPLMLSFKCPQKPRLPLPTCRMLLQISLPFSLRPPSPHV